MITWHLAIGIFCGLVVGAAATIAVRKLLVPASMLRLFKSIPKTMRFDLATPQSMRNMVVMAEPWLEPWFSESAAGRMLAALRAHHPPPPVGGDVDDDVEHQGVTYFPSGPPPFPVSLPPEYGMLDAVIIVWPWHYPVRWAAQAKMIKAIVDAKARALVLMPDGYDRTPLLQFLNESGANTRGVDILTNPADDVWVRDYGPTIVMTPQGPAIIANPYAPGEHPYRKGDNAASFAIGAALKLPVYRLPLLIEGGNMVSDGHGLMVVTDAVLDRNPELGRNELSAIMRRYFGCDRMLLIESLPAEVTGHADMSLRFLSARHAVVASAPPGHRWATAFDRLAALLGDVRSFDGQPFKIDRLPIAVSRTDKNAFWSYVNCVQVNGTTIVPTFGQPTDEGALDFYRSLGLGPVVGVDFSDFLVGSVHCQTKEVPSGVLRRNFV